jgi:transketolase
LNKPAVKIATRDAYGDALVEIGDIDSRVVVLDADLAQSTKSIKFKKRFPERFFDVGIAEQNMMGIAAGLAAAGKIPFASTFAIFASGRAWEQVRTGISYPAFNVKIAGSHAGLTVGEDGASHQALEDIALMRVIPGMHVYVPADAVETRKVVMAAARMSGPVYIRLSRPASPVLFDDDYDFEAGRISEKSVLRTGEDIGILATGYMVHEALKAADLLDEEGVRATVVNVSSIKPIDRKAIIRLARQCGAIVTAEDHSIIGGLGSAVSEVLSEEYPVFLERVGIKDAFGQSGKPGELLKLYGLTPDDIKNAALRAIWKKRGSRD